MRRIYVLAMLTLIGYSCGQTTETKEETVQTTETEATQDAGSYESLLNDYIELKNALVASDAEKAAASAAALAEDAEATEAVKTHSTIIAETTDLDIQREHFYTLSESMYGLLKNAGSLNRTVYLQYCPMARDNQGANWLSLESDILNPYFGDAMLTCGSVEEVL